MMIIVKRTKKGAWKYCVCEVNITVCFFVGFTRALPCTVDYTEVEIIVVTPPKLGGVSGCRELGRCLLGAVWVECVPARGGVGVGALWPAAAGVMSFVFMRRVSLMAYHPSDGIDYL